MKELLLIDEATVVAHLTLDEAMKAVETAFVAHVSGKGRLFPVVKEKYTDLNSFSLKSGVMTEPSTVGVKAAGSWRGNNARGLPTVQATILLVDPDTGEPLAIIAGKTLTTLRTGAAGGVAAKVLLRPDAKTLAVIGTGVQGIVQSQAVLAVRPGVTTIRVANSEGAIPEAFRNAFTGKVEIVCCERPAAAVNGADIVVTTTPTTAALIDLADVAPGAHVTAVGADSPGKREIGADLLAKARRYVDSAAQARAIGEHQYARDLPVTELGAVLSGKEPFVRAADDITLFDSTGIAFQDLAAARKVFDLVVAAGGGRRVPWPT